MTKITELPKEYDHTAVEDAALKLWADNQIYAYDANRPASETFSVDTPPPYASADHLHVGHAMSYSQAEFVVRFQRMLGKNIYYPMGFDDNGLPTERHVEKKYNINKKITTRSEFRKLCLEETQNVTKTYTNLWKRMGLSVDWNQSYSTIDAHCQRTSQKSFLDLVSKNRIYRSDQPVLWDTVFDTALAQADLETIERKGTMWDIAFKSAADGTDLIISTTRPELLAGCVALYCHPEDARYQSLLKNETKAIVPLFGHQVSLYTSEEVDPEFGTGLMMCCTFGDAEDVAKWQADKLETRLVIGRDGKLTELAGEFAGLQVAEAKSKIAKALAEAGFIRGEKKVDQQVSVGERSGQPAEFNMVPQWFIKVLDHKADFLKRSDELKWFPEFMKVRLADWVNGLKYDWNITRQRFYGVPIPVWYCENCNEPHFATEDMLPVDPLETPCPHAKCSACGGTEFVGDGDVLDTWMTSSCTPQIASNWAGSPNREAAPFPMSIRVQGFEIIRTWLFYTLVKADAHNNSLPWEVAMVSGWGLNEQGKKISKRDMEKYTDANGYNRYNPSSVMEKFGADALRWWSSGTQLGNSLKYSEKDVQAGRKIAIKLWNVARYVTMSLNAEGAPLFDPSAEVMPIEKRSVEDRWLLAQLNSVTERMTEKLHAYDYATAKDYLEKFFWQVLCDNYLEIVKDKLWHPERYDEASIRSTQQTLWQVLRQVTALFAPYIPFVTEEIYQQLFAKLEGTTSVHISAWPKAKSEWSIETPEMELLLQILDTCRALRTQEKLSQGKELSELIINSNELDSTVQTTLKSLAPLIQSATRFAKVSFDASSTPSEGFALTFANDGSLTSQSYLTQEAA